MWIRWDSDGNEIWRSSTRDDAYVEVEPYNRDSLYLHFYLIISGNVLTAENTNDSYACMETVTKQQTVDKTAVTFHILAKDSKECKFSDLKEQ